MKMLVNFLVPDVINLNFSFLKRTFRGVIDGNCDCEFIFYQLQGDSRLRLFLFSRCTSNVNNEFTAVGIKQFLVSTNREQVRSSSHAFVKVSSHRVEVKHFHCSI